MEAEKNRESITPPRSVSKDRLFFKRSIRMSPLRNEKDGGAVRCNHGGYVGIGMGNNSLPSSGRLRRAPRRL